MYMSWAGPVSRAGVSLPGFGSFVKHDKNQLWDYDYWASSVLGTS